VQSLAGVSGATVTSALPPFGGPQVEATIAGEDAAAATTVSMVRATDGYFAVLGAPLVRGRPLAEDARDEPRDVAVVNSALVRALLKQQDPVGRQIVLTMPAQPNRPASVRSFEIVGEVRDFRNRGLRVPPGPEVYLPGVSPQGASALVVRGSIEPALLTRAIGRELGAIDGRIGSTVQPWSGTLDRSYYAQPRFSLQVLGVFSVTGMLLVGLGVYSVMSYTVSRQSHDIAVRLALGARRSQVWRGVLGWAGALVAMGLTVGVAATFGTNRLLADQLWNTPRHDPATLAATAILVAVVAVLACLVPAWRAMTVDPLTVLRRD
jgi:putative ABC transport system permease protein